MSKQVSSKLKMCAVAAAAGILCSTASAAAPEDTVRVIVKFKPGAKASIKAAAANANAKVQEEIFGMDAMALEVPLVALKGLENNPNVEYVEEDLKRYAIALTTPSTGTPYASGQAVPYGIKQVQADLLSDVNVGNRKVCDQRDHDFRVRRRIAGDVTREGMHVRHDDGLALDGGGAADAAAEGNAGAGRLALEGADQQVVAVALARRHGEVKTGPIQVGQGVVDEGGKLRGVRHQVAFAFEDALDLALQQGIVGTGAAFGIDVHGRAVWAVAKRDILAELPAAPGPGVMQPAEACTLVP